jgi:DMSO/TMAO reductase YedYZ molybdopterin-dependent catalytic subunit
MKTRLNRLALFGIPVLALNLSVASPAARGQSGAASLTTSTPAALTVSGDVAKPLSLSLEDLRQQPRQTISVKNEHSGKDEMYEGTSLAGLLKRAGVPQGSALRGKAMTTYVLAEGSDGYKVIFSLAELDSDFEDSGVIVADTADGKPVGDKLGPVRLVVPHDKRATRWVRMLRSIQVVNVSK